MTGADYSGPVEALTLDEAAVRVRMTLKGLNYTLGSALVEMNATDQEMQATMARSKKMVAHYSRRANRKSLSKAGFALLSDWLTQSNTTDENSNSAGSS